MFSIGRWCWRIYTWRFFSILFVQFHQPSHNSWISISNNAINFDSIKTEIFPSALMELLERLKLIAWQINTGWLRQYNCDSTHSRHADKENKIVYAIDSKALWFIRIKYAKLTQFSRYTEGGKEAESETEERAECKCVKITVLKRTRTAIGKIDKINPLIKESREASKCKHFAPLYRSQNGLIKQTHETESHARLVYWLNDGVCVLSLGYNSMCFWGAHTCVACLREFMKNHNLLIWLTSTSVPSNQTKKNPNFFFAAPSDERLSEKFDTQYQSSRWAFARPNTCTIQ